MPATDTWIDEFDDGLARFRSAGVVRSASMFQTPQGRVVGPQTGNAICIIDDPFATKADGTRSSAAAGAPSYENRFPGLRDASNAVEVEFWDGAELSIEDVEIAPGRELQFEWCFVRGASPLGGGAELDAALLVECREGGGERPLLLADTGSLRALGREHTGWRGRGVAYPHGFRGTLRWICANGAIRNPAAPASSPFRKLFPSALLLDCVKVL